MSDRIQIVEKIKEEALKILREKYGHLPYHNGTHTEFVLECTTELAEKIDLPESEKELAILAAVAHDVNQDTNPLLKTYDGQNERASSSWVREKMATSGVFSEEEIEHVERAIISTYIKHREEGLRQSAEYKAIVSEILCDADLANLGSPWEIYIPKMADYFKEIYPSATLKEWKHFLEEQIPILLQHHYYTTAAQKQYPHLRENAEKLEKLLQDPEAIQKSFEAN